MGDIKEDLEVPADYKYITAFITMRCNLGCSFCNNALSGWINRKGYIEVDGENWINGLNRLKLRRGLPITFTGGEPFEHPDFIKIINGLNPDLEIDILTNLSLKKGLERFIEEVSPERLKRDSKYPSIRISYHPEQMKDGGYLVQNAKRMKDAGFDIGIYSVLYPSPENLQAITQMQFRCANEGILFRVKDFMGTFAGITYGDYSKYPGAVFSDQRQNCLCKTSDLIIGPNMNVYKCHRDLYKKELEIGNLLDPNFKIKHEFKECNNYGECHPCDVKVKTDYKQNLGHTSVEIIRSLRK